MSDSTRRQGRRLVQGVTSQGLSSLSNFLLVVAVARTSSPDEFGAFAIVYSIAVLALLALRGAVGETLVVTGRADANDAPPALGAGMSLGLSAGTALAVVGLLLPPGDFRPWLLALGTGLPVLALQDAGRYVGFARQQPAIAIVSDAVWLTLQLIAWTALAILDRSSAPSLLVAWWLAAGLASVVVVRSTGTPAPISGLRWLGRNRRIASSFAAESLLSSGASQAAVYAVGGAAGLAAAGTLRGTQTLYGPVRAISAGIEAVALP
jgi:O-antigen/teichoic acid export membrane protein